MNNEIIIKELNKLVLKAQRYNEVPIAALIVYNNKIIARTYNKTEQKQNVLGHAEIDVIKKASKKLNNWRLNNCALYVTLEPCSMCKEIIKKARINNIYYFIKQNNEETESNPNYNYIKNDNFADVLTNFFKNKR
ncbi:MAG: nucleoside deaminase [Bacilli bacterium]|nr:nucleoside deaminase [Bacilli bacterium]